MAANRKIKSDGEIHIDGTNVDIESTVDVSGDVNATGDLGGATATVSGDTTVGGTLGVTGQSTLSGLAYPTSDGDADQVLKTNGSGTLSWTTVSSGGGADTDTIASASDASSYSGTAKFINITATENITMPFELADRIINITGSGTYTVTFEAGADATDKMDSCIIRCSNSSATIAFNQNSGTSDVVFEDQMRSCDIQSRGEVQFKPIERFRIKQSKVQASTIKIDNSATPSESLQFTACDLLAQTFYTSDTTTAVNIWYGTRAEARYVYGKFDLTNGGTLKASKSSNSNTVLITNDDGTLINTTAPLPFEANEHELKTRVICKAFVNSDYTISTSGTQKIAFNETEYDTYGAFDTSSNEFDVPVSGYYNVTANVVLEDFTGYSVLKIYKGTSTHTYAYFGANGDDRAGTSISYQHYYAAGDTIRAYIDSTGGLEDNNYTLAGRSSIGGGHVSILMVSKIN